MREQLIFVPKKVTTTKKILNILWFALACICFLGATFIAPPVFMLPALGFSVLWFFMQFRSNIEFEYTYYDGELKFAKIRNKARRKGIARINMDDVLQLAPKGDRSVYKYENDNSVKTKNLTSGDPEAKVYVVVSKSEAAVTKYEFEPDEDMLDAIMVKYPRVVIK